MEKLDKVILYFGLGLGIFLQWLTIHHTGLETREFLGLMSLIVFLLLIVFLIGKIKKKKIKKIKENN